MCLLALIMDSCVVYERMSVTTAFSIEFELRGLNNQARLLVVAQPATKGIATVRLSVSVDKNL